MTSAEVNSIPESSGRYFHLFSYGSNPEGGLAAQLPAECELVARKEVAGTLYDIAGEYQALVLAGTGRVPGEVWRCPVEVLRDLDRDERVVARELRRVGVEVGEFACWTYVVGPKLASRLMPA